MPNWCENDITITGPAEDLAAMLKACEGEARENDPATVLEFDKVIPYPKRFADLDEAAAAENERIEKMPEADRKEHLRVHGWPKDGYNQGGHEWCCENWGTKWPASDTRNVVKLATRVKATFDTAWAPPIPVIVAASQQFPTLTFNLRFFEQGAAFKGILVAKSGEIVREETTAYHGHRGG